MSLIILIPFSLGISSQNILDKPLFWKPKTLFLQSQTRIRIWLSDWLVKSTESILILCIELMVTDRFLRWFSTSITNNVYGFGLCNRINRPHRLRAKCLPIIWNKIWISWLYIIHGNIFRVNTVQKYQILWRFQIGLCKFCSSNHFWQ